MASTPQIDHRINQFLSFTQSPIIDLRTGAEFCAGHIINASHFPVGSLIERMHELPRRDQSLRLYGSAEQIKNAHKQLTEKGYQIDDQLRWQTEVESRLRQAEMISEGTSSRRLWQPAKIVEEFVNLCRAEVTPGKSLDIGCGAGRDSVFLALNGWQASAVDYLPGAIQKLEALAQNHAVTVKPYLLDLESEDTAIDQIKSQFDLILVVRYLHRPLLEKLRKKINPGGYIVYQTFMQGCEKFGRPKNPRFLLAPGELAGIYHDFEIIKDEVEVLQDGRPTNVFIGQKPYSS